MSVLVYAETSERKYKKSAFEVTSYGKKIAEMLGKELVVCTVNSDHPEFLFTYGAEKVIQLENEQLNKFNAGLYTQVLSQIATQVNAEVIILESSSNSLYLAPLLAVDQNAGYASNAVALPKSTQPFILPRKAFSSKAFNNCVISSDVKIISLSKNSYGVIENKTEGTIEQATVSVGANNMEVVSVEKSSGKVTIADADIVVSGGRGLKGPENWGMVEELAEVLGAATACSKPVSDLGWRPHSEHVGQTGKPVASNLYIAIGISGAIQHLAGVNSSKVKVVINTDPEAPFFKAADYGVVGDAFEVVPELIEKIKDFKANNT